MNNRIGYQSLKSVTEKDPVIYKLAKGRSSKPKSVGMCGSSRTFRVGEQWRSRLCNDYILAEMVPVERVQSRHRVSPSPRKIPRYVLESTYRALVEKHFPMSRN